MKHSRKALFQKLGVTPTNERWSWCAMDERQSKAVFTIWKDRIEGHRTVLTSTDSDITRRPGFKDQERVIEKVINHNLPAYGLVCEAVNTLETPRTIKTIDETYVVRLAIKRVKGIAVATHVEKVHFADVARANADSAIDDLAGSAPPGNQAPDRALQTGYSYKRDPKVRAHVLKRANGRCEYCGKEGFLMANGERFVEAHHIISLAEQGPDSVENVIALCPDHHREAHYGANAEELETAFLDKLKGLQPD